MVLVLLLQPLKAPQITQQLSQAMLKAQPIRPVKRRMLPRALQIVLFLLPVPLSQVPMQRLQLPQLLKARQMVPLQLPQQQTQKQRVMLHLLAI
jgi:hypothetical protein